MDVVEGAGRDAVEEVVEAAGLDADDGDSDGAGLGLGLGLGLPFGQGLILSPTPALAYVLA